MNGRAWLVVAVCAAMSVLVETGDVQTAYATGFGAGGCGGSGGGGTAGIGASLACGLPPPAAPTPQNDGSGILGVAPGPPLDSRCIATKRLPTGVIDPTTG